METIKQALQKTDLSEEQVRLSGAKVKSAVLQRISTFKQPLLSFSFNPLLGVASCALGLLLGIMLQTQNQLPLVPYQQAYNNELEIFSGEDYTVVAFLNIMED